MAEMLFDASTDRYNDPNRVTVTKAANHLYELIREVQAKGRRKLLTKHGRVIAAITPLSEVAIVDDVMSAQHLKITNP